MKKELLKFCATALELSDNWNDHYDSSCYPTYLPSFDEFASDALSMREGIDGLRELGGYSGINHKMDQPMEGVMNKFVSATVALAKAWDDDLIQEYPSYLPSFTEFAFDIIDMKDGVPTEDELSALEQQTEVDRDNASEVQSNRMTRQYLKYKFNEFTEENDREINYVIRCSATDPHHLRHIEAEKKFKLHEQKELSNYISRCEFFKLNIDLSIEIRSISMDTMIMPMYLVQKDHLNK
jgi:hypothetical protein